MASGSGGDVGKGIKTGTDYRQYRPGRKCIRSRLKQNEDTGEAYENCYPATKSYRLADNIGGQQGDEDWCDVVCCTNRRQAQEGNGCVECHERQGQEE